MVDDWWQSAPGKIAPPQMGMGGGESSAIFPVNTVPLSLSQAHTPPQSLHTHNYKYNTTSCTSLYAWSTLSDKHILYMSTVLDMQDSLFIDTPGNQRPLFVTHNCMRITKSQLEISIICDPNNLTHILGLSLWNVKGGKVSNHLHVNPAPQFGIHVQCYVMILRTPAFLYSVPEGQVLGGLSVHWDYHRPGALSLSSDLHHYLSITQYVSVIIWDLYNMQGESSLANHNKPRVTSVWVRPRLAPRNPVTWWRIGVYCTTPLWLSVIIVQPTPDNTVAILNATQLNGGPSY